MSSRPAVNGGTTRDQESIRPTERTGPPPLYIMLLTVVLAAACASPESPRVDTEGATQLTSTEYQPPEQVRNTTFVWSAEPDVDLFDERGRLIRAAQESKIIAYYAGIDVTYPASPRRSIHTTQSGSVQHCRHLSLAPSAHISSKSTTYTRDSKRPSAVKNRIWPHEYAMRTIGSRFSPAVKSLWNSARQPKRTATKNGCNGTNHRAPRRKHNTCRRSPPLSIDGLPQRKICSPERD